MNNTLAQVVTPQIETRMKAEEAKMRRIFAEAPTMDIQIQKDKDSKDNTWEGGINGHFFTLKRGVPIRDVPMPIVDVLDETGEPYSRMSLQKPSAAMLAKQQAAVKADAEAEAAAKKKADAEAKKAAKEAAKNNGDSPPA